MTVADLAAERAVLGAMLLAPKQAVPAAAELLSAADFFRGAHGTVFDAVCSAHVSATVDPMTVGDELERRGQLDDIGGPTELVDMLREAPAGAVVVHAARIVADKAARRRTAEAAARLAAAASDPTVDLADTVAAYADTFTIPTTRNLRLLPADSLDELVGAEWLVDGIVPDGVTVLYGPSGAGKSFVAQDWACSVAAGRAWFGKAVERRKVVYVAGEGASGLASRFAAWSTDRHADVNRVAVVTEPIDLLSVGDVRLLSQAVTDWNAGLVVLDTLARTMVGDENSTEAMSGYVRACDRLRSDHGCAVVVVHHTGVEPTRMRGNTALFAAADSVIRVHPDEPTGVVVSQPPPPGGKAKDAAHFDPWHLVLRPVADSVVPATTVARPELHAVEQRF